MVGRLMALLHLGYDVATGRNFPIVDVWNMPKGVEFVPNPKRPLAVTARVADENVRHVNAPLDGPPRSARR